MRKIRSALFLLMLIGSCFLLPHTGRSEEAVSTTREYNGPFTWYGQTTKLTCSYKDVWFLEDGDVYNHDLAKMSLSLAMSAFGDESKPVSVQKDIRPEEYYLGNPDPAKSLEESPACNAVQLLHSCGFTDICVNKDFLLTTRYDEDCNDGNHIGICIGRKALDARYDLLAVALRGGGYGCEWIGNFNIYGEVHYHKGFAIARARVVSFLEDYIAEHTKKQVKLWITGYSRSAAAANLTAGYLLRNGLAGREVSPADMYAYTFEAPRGTKVSNAASKRYGGIFNIINPVDLVPYTAMEAWGYRRYGRDILLPDPYTAFFRYHRYEHQVLLRYNAVSSMEREKLPLSDHQLLGILGFTNALAGLLGDENSEGTRILQEELTRMIQKVSREQDLTGVLEYVLRSYPVLSAAIGTTAAANPLLTGQELDFITSTVLAHDPLLILAWMETIPSRALRFF